LVDIASLAEAAMGERPDVKGQVRALLDALPEDCTLEDIQYHLYVLEKIARSEARIREEGAVSHEDAKARFAKWLKP
jgi:hypothetical protein